MAKLPVYHSQGGIATDVPTNIRRPQDYNIMGDALGAVSKQIVELGERWQAAKDEVENLDGKNKLMMGVQDVLTEAQQFNTWTNAKDLDAKKQELTAKMNSLTPDVMQGFSNNRNAGIFQRNAEYIVYQNQAKLDQIFRDKYQDMNDSNINISYDSNFNNFITTGNYQYRDAFLADVQSSVNAGFMTREQATALTQKTDKWGKYHILHMAETNPTGAINALKSGKYKVKPEDYNDTLQELNSIKTNKKLEQEYRETIRQDQFESQALSYVTSNKYTYSQKTQFIDNAELNGDISTTTAARLRRGIKSQKPSGGVSNATAISDVLQQVYDLDESAKNKKEYLIGIQNIRSNIIELHEKGLIDSKDANSLNKQIDNTTRKKIADATNSVTFSSEWKDAKAYINISLPPQLRATATRDVFYAMQNTDTTNLKKEEVQKLYKDQAVKVVSSMKTNDRAKTLQVINNPKKQENNTQIKDGTIIRNSKTGQRMQLKGGKWQVIK